MASTLGKITERFSRDSMGQTIDAMMDMSKDRRRRFERRWYENNFFDDGYHFRYISRSTGKVVDLSKRSINNTPVRAIPKASRQIRGVANLLLTPDYVPVVYPERVDRSSYDLSTEAGKEIYMAAIEDAKNIAKRIGHWIEEEWTKDDISEKLMLMAILAAKHGVSYMQIWPDAVDEKINSRVYDAFDIYLLGDLDSIYDSPFIIKTQSTTLARIRANELFDYEKAASLTAENKYASSELKDAYKKARFGTGREDENAVSIILKEAFIKEYLTKENFPEIASRHPKVIEGKKVGDQIIRHVFSAGGVTLRDEYLKINEYPFVEFRYEPGPIYQTPLIERFIPLNKSLDVVMSRIEQWSNTMASGHWLKRRGEDFRITNIGGGAVYEYDSTPPVQGNIAPLPQTIEDFVLMLEKLIEEQGTPVNLNQLPQGVKSGVAIESLKETEFLNLTIASKMMKKTVQDIAKRYIELAADNYYDIQTIERLERGEPDYFDIIGQTGMELRAEIDDELPEGTVVINRDIKVDVEVEAGAGFTRQGRREVAQQVLNFVLQLSQAGAVPPEFVKMAVEKAFAMFNFGNTAEIAEALDNPTPQDLEGARAEQTEADLEEDIQKTKVGVLEALRDAGLLQTPQGGNDAQPLL